MSTPPPPPCVEGDEEGCLDGGTLPEDLCNSKDEASADSRCQLTLGEGKVGYISTLADGGWDRDWYLAQMPATLNGRSLLHVSAGYPASVPQTAVNFQVNVLEEGTTSITTGLDKHGTTTPKPVDLVLPYGKASARLYVLVSDEGTTATPRVDEPQRLPGDGRGHRQSRRQRAQ